MYYVWLELHAWWTESLVNDSQILALVLQPKFHVKLALWSIGELMALSSECF